MGYWLTSEAQGTGYHKGEGLSASIPSGRILPVVWFAEPGSDFASG